MDDVGGVAFYSYDHSAAGRLAAALGIKEIRFLHMFWGGVVAVADGMADCVVTFRFLAQVHHQSYGRSAGA